MTIPNRRRLVPLLLGVFLIGACFAAGATTLPQDGDIVVVGERNGPRLWRLIDGEAEIFVLVGTDFIPEDLEWNDSQIVQIMEETREVLVTPDADVGAGNRARLIGAMIRTLIFNRRRIMMAKGVTLEDRVGPELASAFRLARARVDARLAANSAREKEEAKSDASDDDPDKDDNETPLITEAEESAIEKRLADLEPERLHPFFQAQQLMADSVESANLDDFDRIEKRVKKLARKTEARPKPKVRPVATFDLAFQDVKQVLRSVKDFSRETDQACIRRAIDFAEQGLFEEAHKARAWAQGDVAFLRAHTGDARLNPCAVAVSKELGTLKTLGNAALADFDGVGQWVEALTMVMETPGVRIALIGSDDWLRPDGALARLRAAGYEVIGP
ncbi:MAG: TraB/GumN family protein [Pseudomonadota bacterium]